jgi:CubicO group peptidase (beta-lactamase class C family)
MRLNLLVAVLASLLAEMSLMPTPASSNDVRQLISDARVPGLSMAVIRDDGTVEVIAAGVRNTHAGTSVDAQTVFDAASLSKPVFAYAVLRLVDAGVLSLDTPLSRYVPDYVSKDARAAGVTVRHALSHSSGLPNWRSADYPLKTYFPPGERFSYSGEGFVWLQRVVEAVTGEPMNAAMNRLVFAPLEMRRSSYVWRGAFEPNYADPHDVNLSPAAKKKPASANAAATLQTTAGDFARFLQVALSGAGLKPETARIWLVPQVNVGRYCVQCLAADAPEVEPDVAWGLGWGLEPSSDTFFHWGDNDRGRFKAFVMGSPQRRSGIVVFTNGSNGMAIMPELVGEILPGEHPVFDWLNYPRHVPGPH